MAPSAAVGGTEAEMEGGAVGEQCELYRVLTTGPWWCWSWDLR